MSDVLLLHLPMGALDRPALGISLLRAELRARGITCDLRYANLDYAELVGIDSYLRASTDLPTTAFTGEWVFAEALYGPRSRQDAEYQTRILREAWRLPEKDIAMLAFLRSTVEPFFEHLLGSVRWEEYRVVGFTSTFEQNLASLAFAKRLKERHPHLVLAFGGANFEGVMGEELHRQFPFVDLVVPGEADQSFPEVVKLILGSRRVAWAKGALDIPGLILRGPKGETIVTPKRPAIRDLDALAQPNFEDFVAAFCEGSASDRDTPTLMVETSRGCWWGAKSHCTFCGLNGATLEYRSKSPERALAELRSAASAWPSPHLQVVDNILDMKYFHSVLPALAADPVPAEIFYEVKANLSREQIGALKAAGVTRIQPGIESLSDHVLTLMRKGTTGLRNIQLLKWCAEFGVEAEWNLLYGFPGETDEDYEEILALLPAIRHFKPPGACGPLRLDRFSPYHMNPAAFGITELRPLPAYSYLYPFPDAVRANIAYYFDFKAPGSEGAGHRAAKVIAAVEAWRADPETGTLWIEASDPEIIRLVDTRRHATTREYRLLGPERAIFLSCSSLQATEAIVADVRSKFPGQRITESRVVRFLESLVERRLAVRSKNRWLNVALSLEPVTLRPPRVSASVSGGEVE